MSNSEQLKRCVEKSFKEGLCVLETFMNDSANLDRILALAKKICEVLDAGGKIMIYGNGGSYCDAAHFAEEFTGRFKKTRRALPAMVIGDSAHLTCVANDFGYDAVFSRGIEAFAKAGDISIGISTSGNSESIRSALELSKKMGLTTVSLLGKGGGKIKGMCDYEWIVPSQKSERIQELHMQILHILIEIFERQLFPEHYNQE